MNPTQAYASTLADNLNPEQRSAAMRQVRSKNTSPELAVRRLLQSRGYSGYRLHRTDIPGKPDIAWIGRKLAIFVHGCFWHGHNCPRGARTPKTRRDYWLAKIERNRQRDGAHQLALKAAGWGALTLWECELDDQRNISKKLRRFLARV